ncbi:MAG: thioredoxin family protein [Gemmatimonadaceae bacterium]|nr:thioredoxin family protein [Gemmatimonadaceae bacterium]
MFFTILLASLGACGPMATRMPTAVPSVQVASDSTLRTIYDKGLTFAEFVEKATARREGWLRLQRDAVVRPALVSRARAVGGNWQVLVIARDGCGDSMNSVPYAARLVDSVPGLSLRIVSPVDGQAAANSHRTADGRMATPTFVLLDSTGADVGCLVELPAPLRQWTNTHRGSVSDDSLHTYRNTFYAKDAGVSVTTELVELLEAARTGTPQCDRQLTR